MTVLVEDADGWMLEAAIHHRPLLDNLLIAAELRYRVGGLIDPTHFISTEMRNVLPVEARD